MLLVLGMETLTHAPGKGDPGGNMDSRESTALPALTCGVSPERSAQLISSPVTLLAGGDPFVHIIQSEVCQQSFRMKVRENLPENPRKIIQEPGFSEPGHLPLVPAQTPCREKVL